MSDAKEMIAAVGGNEALQNAVASLIQRSITAFDSGVAFFSEQIPDVVMQLLIWKATVSALGTLFGIMSLVALVVVWIKCSGQGKKINPELGNLGNHRLTLTHDLDGDFSPHIIVSAFATAVWIMISVTSMSLTWLQILIAPKLFLIEYAASLVK